ncbi:EAL domain-containing protein [Cupriavidus basilensis]
MTEGLLMEDDAGIAATVAAIHAQGVRLSMDDFGTGYSSLGYLRQLPVHQLKLDKSFVIDLESDAAARELASAVIQYWRQPETRGGRRRRGKRSAAPVPALAGMPYGTRLSVPSRPLERPPR